LLKWILAFGQSTTFEAVDRINFRQFRKHEIIKLIFLLTRLVLHTPDNPKCGAGVLLL
jgi:hypothetical protein